MNDLELLKRLVIAFDADQDEEFHEALAAAREHCGFELADDADEVLGDIKARHADEADAEEDLEDD